MWKPPERIRWSAESGEAPSTEQLLQSGLFKPLNQGRLQLNNRTWVPAMVPWRATEEGFVTQDNLDWYARFAAGGPGAIVVEATGIRDVPSGPLLRLGHDRYIEGMARLVDVVRKASNGQCRLFVQLIDFLAIRRRPNPGRFFSDYLQITPALIQRLEALDVLAATDPDSVRSCLTTLKQEELALVLDPRDLESLQHGYRERVTDTHLAQIRDLPAVLPEQFAAAAERAVKAGFDGVELHYAHAYTMASFLSATNTRVDGYGGSVENRLQVPMNVFDAVRSAVAEDFVVGSRLLADECIEGGSSVEDASYFATRFAEAGMDFISLSRGGKFDDAKQPRVGQAAYPYTGPSGYECMPQYLSDKVGPFGRNFDAAKTIRKAIRSSGCSTPVVVAGGIHNFELANRVLSEGIGDVVATARQSLADPDWVNKLQFGCHDEIRVCEYTNYCEGLDQKHKQVTCQLWDRIDRDKPGVRLTHDGKRRLVPPDWVPKAL